MLHTNMATNTLKLLTSLKTVVVVVFALMLSSCTSTQTTLKISDMPSSNSSYRVKSLVMHFTAVNYARSIDFLVSEGGGVSSHYLIPKLNDDTYPHDSLRVLQLVDETERAWHAGVSYWQGRNGLNDSSIGIEIVNTPECFERDVPPGFIKPKASCIYPDFEDEQIALLIELSKGILARNPDISPTAVVGHSDIAPSRKNDPGPRFPWQKLYEAGVGAWYDKQTVGKYWQYFDAQAPSIGLLQRALNVYGYKIAQTGVLDKQTQDVIGAFQMHFIPWQVNYQADASTAATLFALLEKYFSKQAEQLIAQYHQSQQELPEHTRQGHQLAFTFVPQVANNLYQNQRVKFVGKANSGNIIINAQHIRHADIFINEQKLNLSERWDQQKSVVYSIAKRTQNGINSLRVANLEGDDNALLKIGLTYPTLHKKPAYDFSQLDALIKNDISNGFPGASVMVIHKGQVVKQSAYGYARKYNDDAKALAEPQAMQVDTAFDLSAKTKVFATTLAIMMLVDQGKLALDSPISAYLTEYNGDGRDTRTIADLLTHASGYSNNIEIFKPNPVFGDTLYSQEKPLTQNIVLKKLPLSGPRRADQAYSDTNFLILGLLVERITQMPLDEFVENQIFAPLKLTHSAFKPLQKGYEATQFAATEIQGNTRGGTVMFDNVRKHVLQGEVHDELAFYSMQEVSGHAGLFSNAYDLGVLAQLLLNGGGYGDTHLFTPQTLQRFVHPEFVKDSIGLGWRLATNNTQWHFGPYASPQAYGLTGDTGVATVIDPELDLAIIYLTNKQHSEALSSDQGNQFAADQYAMANYGNIMTLIYEAILAKK
ncbi:MAG: penicillin binding protein PBP4B [Glaciecola sp.]